MYKKLTKPLFSYYNFIFKLQKLLIDDTDMPNPNYKM